MLQATSALGRLKRHLRDLGLMYQNPRLLARKSATSLNHPAKDSASLQPRGERGDNHNRSVSIWNGGIATNQDPHRLSLRLLRAHGILLNAGCTCMFTSRGPRNREEIAACVAVFLHSPHGKDSGLSKEDMVECWYHLLRLGVGVIDFIQNEIFAGLKDNERAISELDPNYEYGYLYVTFACFVTFDVARDILIGESDDVDPIVRVLHLYRGFRLKDSAESPLPRIGKHRELLDKSISMVSCGIFHSDLSSPSLRHVPYLPFKSAFTKRLYASLAQFANGFSFDISVHSAAGDFFLEPLQSAGLHLMRKHSANSESNPERNRYVFCTARPELYEMLGRRDMLTNTQEKNMSEYNFKHFDPSIPRQAGLTRYEQQLCFYLLNGYENLQIARRTHKDTTEEEAYFRNEILRMKSLRKTRKLTTFEERELKSYENGLANIPGRISQALNQVARKLQKLRFYRFPFRRKKLVAVLSSNPIAAHEIRQFIFSVYPWPDDIDSRAM